MTLNATRHLQNLTDITLTDPPTRQPLLHEGCRSRPLTPSKPSAFSPIRYRSVNDGGRDHSRAKTVESLKAASVRLVASSFFMMLRMCTLTVLSDMASS